MKKALIADARFFEIAKAAWGDEYDIIPSAEINGIDSAISFHPDVQLVNVSGNIICAPCVYEYYKKALLPYGINLVQGEKNPVGNYPDDSAYNIAMTENIAFFKKGTADNVVLNYMRENSIKAVYVNQGYAKCSSVTFPHGIITADSSIYKALTAENVSCLKIREGFVELKPYEYGFLGGASGYADGSVLFFGDIKKHPDYIKISEFLKMKKIDMKYIKNYPLTDIGTIFFPY